MRHQGGSSASTDSSTSSGDSGVAKKSAKSSAPSRPISYFSSVSTDDYRDGWDNIFAKPTTKSKNKTSRRPRAAKPLQIELTADDLDAEARAVLEEVLRRQLKKQRRNYDKLAAAGQVDWKIACEVRPAS